MQICRSTLILSRCVASHCLSMYYLPSLSPAIRHVRLQKSSAVLPGSRVQLTHDRPWSKEARRSGPRPGSDSPSIQTTPLYEYTLAMGHLSSSPSLSYESSVESILGPSAIRVTPRTTFIRNISVRFSFNHAVRRLYPGSQVDDDPRYLNLAGDGSVVLQ